jgi:hypothetical protein
MEIFSFGHKSKKYIFQGPFKVYKLQFYTNLAIRGPLKIAGPMGQMSNLPMG